MKCARFALVAGLFVLGDASRGQTPAEEVPAVKPAANTVGSSPSWRTAIDLILNQRGDFNFVKMPLKDAIGQLHQQYKINTEFDAIKLGDAGIDLDSLIVNFNAQGINLRLALRTILQNFEMNFVAQDEVLLITTQEVASSILETEVYDVADLVANKGSIPNYDPLISLIVGTVTPQSWPEGTGPARIGRFKGCLIFEQTREVHEEIGALLDTLRKVRKLQSSGSVGGTVALPTLPPKLEKLLALKTNLQCQEMPLIEVVQELKSNTGVEFIFDSKCLANADIDPATLRVTIDVNNISVRAALNQLCRPQGLSWIAHDDVVKITTQESDCGTQIRIYPIADLAGPHSEFEPGDKLNTCSHDADYLAAEIRENISSETWSGQGGQGTIDAFDYEYPVLVVSQNSEVHDSIAELLANLRRIRTSRIETFAKQASEPPELETPFQKIYLLKAGDPKAPAMSAKETVDLVKTLVAPMSWNEDGIFIQCVTGRLVVRQRPAAQREIGKLLIDLDALLHVTKTGFGDAKPGNADGSAPDNSGGGGFGGGGLGGGGMGGIGGGAF